MLVTALERERQQIFQNGLREGKQEGLLEGEQKGKQEGLLEGEQKGRIETAKAMLAKGMEMTLITWLNFSLNTLRHFNQLFPDSGTRN